MHKVFYILGLCMACSFSCQAGEPQGNLNAKLDSLDKQIEALDSDMQQFYQQQEEMRKKQQDEMLEKSLEQNQRNLERFLAEDEARKKKQRRSAWIRGIGLGAVLLSLIISRIRKSKSKE